MAGTSGLVAGAVLTMDPDQPLLCPAFVAWDGTRLHEVRAARPEDLRTPGVRDLRGHVVLPGFVNVHHHVTSAALTGIGDDTPPTLAGTAAQPSRARVVAAIDREASRALAALGYLELARAGVTTTTDSQSAWRYDQRVDGTAEAAAASGLRVHLAVAFLDRSELIPRDAQHTPLSAVAELERVRQDHASDRVEVEGEPLSLPRASDALVRALHAARHRLAAMHLTYSRSFEQWAERELGRRAVEHLDHLGVLDDGWLFAHPLHLDDTERRLLADRGARVAYCPVSNLHMGLESPNLRPLRDLGVPLGLGLDHPNGSHDVLQNAKVAALAQRSAAGDAGAWTALDSLHALTVGGARALGLDDRVGMLRAGHEADLVALRGLLPPTSPAHPATLDGVAERVVMSGAREHVTDVLAAGRWLVTDGTPTLDEAGIRAEATTTLTRLLAPGPRHT